MAERSNRVANWLRARGVKRGERMLLMLGNVVPLWEVTLAAIKLGAVVSPATTLLSAADLTDRVQRGQMRHVVADAAGAARFAEVPGDYTRTLVGGSAAGLDRLCAGRCRAGRVRARRPDARRRPAAAVLHQRHHRPAEDGAAHAAQLPGGPPDDDVLAGPAARRRAPEHQLAGLGQTCVEQLLRAVECRRDHLRAQPGALRRQVHARHAGALRRHLAVRAAHGVARADPGRPGEVAGQAERGDRRRRAAEPRGHRARARRLGADAARRLRPDRKHLHGRQPAGAGGARRLDGPADARLPHGAARHRRPRMRRGRTRGQAAARAHRADGRLCRRRTRRRRPRWAAPTTAPATSRGAMPTATSGTWAAPTTCSRPATTASAPSSWKARCSNTRPWPRPRWCPAPTRSSWRCPRPTSCSSPGRRATRETALDILRFLRERLSAYKRVRRIEFAELPKTISGKIRRVQLRQAEDERRARGERGALEFWEEDFRELK